MFNLDKLIKVLTERYEATHKDVSLPAPYAVPLYAEPTQKQLDQLKNGDGNPIAEMCQINSSAGLAYNYYKMYESEMQKEHKCFEVNFEDKVAKPLSISGGRMANLDVSYSLDGTQYYVESKFLEPYYSKCKHNTPSYRNQNYYKFPEKETALWLGLLDHEKDFLYYDFPQLYRHLLAIHRRHNRQGKVVLQSVSWKMTSTFKKMYGLTKEDEDMLKALDDERQEAYDLLNGFLKEMGWTGCRFEARYYNDMLDAIKGSSRHEEFCKQYFLD